MEKVDRLVNTARLTAKLSQVERLAIIVESALGISSTWRARECLWPLIRGRRLIVLTDDPHLATQARFMQKTLCKHVNTELKLNIISLDIKLISLPLARFGRKITRLPLSPQVAQTLIYIAEDIKDEGLRQSLLGIAATARSTQTVITEAA